MKKLLLTVITSFIATATLFAQTNSPSADEINALQQNTIVSSTNYQPMISNNPSFLGGSFVGCDSITTTYVSNNGLAGAMFDVVADSNLVINGMYTNLSVASAPFEIYFKTGTGIGFEQNAAAWTLLGSDSIISSGVDVPTLVSIPISVSLIAGDRVAFYVTNSSGNTAGLKYTNGVGAGNLYLDNGALKIYEGNGITYPFGNIFADRVWNGTLNYCTTTTGINDVTKKAIDVYPNPVTDKAMFNFGDARVTSLVITSVDGKKVFEEKNITSSIYNFERKSLTNGFYFYAIFSGSNLVAKGKLLFN